MGGKDGRLDHASMSTLTSQAWLIFDVGEVDVSEAGAAEIGTPEHGSCKIPLELLRHGSSRRVAAVAALSFLKSALFRVFHAERRSTQNDQLDELASTRRAPAMSSE